MATPEEEPTLEEKRKIARILKNTTLHNNTDKQAYAALVLDNLVTAQVNKEAELDQTCFVYQPRSISQDYNLGKW